MKFKLREMKMIYSDGGDFAVSAGQFLAIHNT